MYPNSFVWACKQIMNAFYTILTFHFKLKISILDLQMMLHRGRVAAVLKPEQKDGVRQRLVEKVIIVIISRSWSNIPIPFIDRQG